MGKQKLQVGDSMELTTTTSEHMEIYLKQEVNLNGCHFYPEGKQEL